MKKFWAQRYKLFSKFDEGILLDEGKSILYNHNSRRMVGLVQVIEGRKHFVAWIEISKTNHAPNLQFSMPFLAST